MPSLRETTAEAPAPVRAVANALTQWIDRLGSVWVEGQITQFTRRPGLNTVFLVLRDPVAALSINVTCSRALFDSLSPPVVEGASVVIHARPSFYPANGSLSLAAGEIRMVGLGELLARLERRRQLLAAEGLFDPARKRGLPFLPRLVGLVTSRDSAAERDVIENARRRWPAVRFETAYAAMQGPRSALEVMEAIERLDARPEVEVIIVARGGGSVEDLLPFSDEALIRVVHGARTPVVSAIGHEPDQPLLDLVADVRASTPTDAAKLVVPDMLEEARQVSRARDRLRRALVARLDREEAALQAIRSRPVLADPRGELLARSDEVAALRDRARRVVVHRLERAGDDITHHLARARALSPLDTLRRGYAVLQQADGTVVRSTGQVATGTEVQVRVADGRIVGTVTRTEQVEQIEQIEHVGHAAPGGVEDD